MRSGTELVTLFGPAMVGLVQAVAALSEAGIARYAVVGGVAVSARLGQAHRATTDVDAVVDVTVPPDAVEALLALPGAETVPRVPHRVLIHGTQLELLQAGPVDDADLEGLSKKDSMFVAAHSWALDTATLLTITAGSDPRIIAHAPFASPGALLAMKLGAIEGRLVRGAPKRGGDAWDIYRLLVDRDADGSIRAELADAPDRLRVLVAEAVSRVLVDNVDQTRAWMRTGGPEMAAVTVDELRYVGQVLVGGIT